MQNDLLLYTVLTQVGSLVYNCALSSDIRLIKFNTLNLQGMSRLMIMLDLGISPGITEQRTSKSLKFTGILHALQCSQWSGSMA